MSFRGAKLANMVEVFDRESSVLYAVPEGDVKHGPSRASKNRPVLCGKGDSCPHATTGTCRFTHADLRNASTKAIHVNYAWKSVDECTYPRLSPGAIFPLREPTSANSSILDAVPSECVLKTRCQLTEGRPASRCAHFYYGRECHLGNKCDFAHVIHLDPDARPYEKAPAPASFGRARGGKDDDEYGDHQFILARGELPPMTLLPPPISTLTPVLRESRTELNDIAETSSVGTDDNDDDGDPRAVAPTSPPSTAFHASPNISMISLCDALPTRAESGFGLPPCPLSESENSSPVWWADETPVTEPPSRTSSSVKLAVRRGSWRYNPYA